MISGKLSEYCFKQNENRVLLSSRILKLFSLFFKISFFFRFSPFSWDGSEDLLLLRDQDTKFYFWNWKLVISINAVNFIFSFTRLLQLLYLRNDSFSVCALSMLYVVCNWLGCLVQMTLIHKRRELAIFINHFIQFCKDVQGKPK